MKVVKDKVVFGHMHEDFSLELSLVNRLPTKRSLVIASGGDLTLALAGAKMEVIAVDSNAAQIDLVRLKMTCPPDLQELCFCGKVDRLLKNGGWFLRWLLDWPRLKPDRCRVFLTDTLEKILPHLVAIVHGNQAAERLSRKSIRLIRHRLELAMKQPEAATNPLLQVLLGNRFGSDAPAVWIEEGIEKWRNETARISLHVADFAQFLRDSETDSLGLISVSNLPDVMNEDAWDRLVVDAARALMPGGYFIVRSMLLEELKSANYGSFHTEANPVCDTSPLCPVVWIGQRI